MNRTTYRERIFKASRTMLGAMFALAFAGFVCQWIYDRSFNYAISTTEVTAAVHAMQKSADTEVRKIEEFLLNAAEDSLANIPFQKRPFTYLVYRGSELIFWSGNQTEPQNFQHSEWRFCTLSNMLALTKSKRTGDYNIVVYVPLKYDFPYENKDLQNVFVPNLKLANTITLTANEPASKYAVFGSADDYLFTLVPPENTLYVECWATAAFVLFSLAYLFLFVVFARFPLLLNKMKLSHKQFLIVSAGVSVFIFASLRFGFPHTFFQNNVFTPYHYASGTFLSTLTHLSFLTAFLCALIYLFTFHVKVLMGSNRFFRLRQMLLLIVPGAYYFLIFNFLIGVVFNSSTEINILGLKDITFVALWNHFLFLIWGLSFLILHVSTRNKLLRTATRTNVLKADIAMSVLIVGACLVLFPPYGFIAGASYWGLTGVFYLLSFSRSTLKSNYLLILWLFLFTLFITGTSLLMNRQKKFDKYRILAENHSNNEDTEEERIAVSMLADLNTELSNDTRIPFLAQFPDSILKANDYVNTKYLRGFWNKYEMRFFSTTPQSEWDKAYEEEITSWGKQIKSTHFYSMHNPNTELTFLGVFRNNTANGKRYNYYMEFYPRKTFKSYSYPNLLIEPPLTIQSQLGLSTARYSFRELVSASGKFKYSPNISWIEKKIGQKYFKQTYRGHDHYIYTPDLFSYYILSEESDGGMEAYILYFFYTLVIYLCITLFFKWVYRLVNHRTRLRYKFSSRYLMSFIVLLILSFISIFYVSMNYIRHKYEDEQIQVLESTRNYIQMALQDKYYWIEKLDSTMIAALNFDLLDLSYMYQTDIHVYDNTGKLIGSSQPAIFSRGLTSRLISPLVYFSPYESINQYEKIGNLEYLTAYTNWYNGDFLQIGYIAVPQFLAKDILKADLGAFLAVIVHIYIIIICLFVVLSFIITRQLSSPLTMLQNSLREMKIGSNTKISYKPKDEIGQLVEQYNQAVDKLELSARMLAQSERESAWKTMARQVAHEINNPLTPMKLTIQHLQHIKSSGDERFEEFFNKASQTLIEQIENLSRIASTFSGFAKLPEPKYERVDVAKKLKSVSVLFANNAENIKISYYGDEAGAFVYADREQLVLVFNNLMKNALQSIPIDRNGNIDLLLETTPTKIVVSIKDNGAGIPEEIKSKLFMPNFTTKSTGMGLGLSICKSIINILGGEITFESTLGAGTTFHVVLPRMQSRDDGV